MNRAKAAKLGSFENKKKSAFTIPHLGVLPQPVAQMSRPEITRVPSRRSIKRRDGGLPGMMETKDRVHQRHMREGLWKVADQAFLA
jgi:hypothetical protein